MTNLTITMKKWNEITYETAVPILISFLKGESWTEGKVLEIQDPFGIQKCYVGKVGMKGDNNSYVQAIKRMKKWGMIRGNYKGTGLCIMEGDKKNILPLLGNPEEVVHTILRGDKTLPKPKWYTKDKTGKRVICPKTYQSTEKEYVTVRTVEWV